MNEKQFADALADGMAETNGLLADISDKLDALLKGSGGKLVTNDKPSKAAKAASDDEVKIQKPPYEQGTSVAMVIQEEGTEEIDWVVGTIRDIAGKKSERTYNVVVPVLDKKGNPTGEEALYEGVEEKYVTDERDLARIDKIEQELNGSSDNDSGTVSEEEEDEDQGEDQVEETVSSEKKSKKVKAKASKAVAKVASKSTGGSQDSAADIKKLVKGLPYTKEQLATWKRPNLLRLAKEVGAAEYVETRPKNRLDRCATEDLPAAIIKATKKYLKQKAAN